MGAVFVCDAGGFLRFCFVGMPCDVDVEVVGGECDGGRVVDVGV